MNIDDIIENAQLKGRVIGLEAQVETLTAEVRCLEAVIRSHERVDCLLVTSLKKQLGEVDAEVARLNSLIANSEQENARKIHGLQQDNEALQNRVDFLEG
jgi:cell division protein FtsB